MRRRTKRKRCLLRKIKYNLWYVSFHHTAVWQTTDLHAGDKGTMSCCVRPQEGDEEDADEAADKLLASHPEADTTIIFTTGEGWVGSICQVFEENWMSSWTNKSVCHSYCVCTMFFNFRVSCQWDCEVPGWFHQQGKSGFQRPVIGGLLPLPSRLPVLHSERKLNLKYEPTDNSPLLDFILTYYITKHRTVFKSFCITICSTL